MNEQIIKLKEQFKGTINETMMIELRQCMSDKLSTDEEFYYVMWMLAKYYESIDNKNACTYCCLRANEILKMNSINPRKRSPFLHFTRFTPEVVVKALIDEKIVFMADKNAHISNQLLMISFLFGSLIFLMSYLIIRMEFFACIIQWVCFSTLSYFMAINKSKRRYFTLQCAASGKYMEDIDKTFDEQY